MQYYKSEGQIADKNRIVEVLGGDFCNELLDIKGKINWIGHFSDTATDVSLPMKFLLDINWLGKKKLISPNNSMFTSQHSLEILPLLVILLVKFTQPIEVIQVNLKRGGEKVYHPTAKQYHQCEDFFSKTNHNIKKHLSVVSAKGSITYSFDNGQIVNFQDNFKYLGDVPFPVYFDFKTATGKSVFSDPRMCDQLLPDIHIPPVLKSRQNCCFQKFSTETRGDV